MRRSCWFTYPADALMHWSCWFTDADDALMLLMYWCCWCTDALMLLNQDQDLLADLSIAICSSFPLNMIPWYPKQIFLHCEEAEKFIFVRPHKTFYMPVSCCQSPPEYTKFTTYFFINGNDPPPPLFKLYKKTGEMVRGAFPKGSNKKNTENLYIIDALA